MNLVAISGHMGSGKDTAADHLTTEFGFLKVALADPIKQYALNVFNFTEDQLWGPSPLRNAPDPRFTTYVGPYEGDDAWMAVFRRAEGFDTSYVDMLFPNDTVKRAMVLKRLRDWRQKLALEHPVLSPRVVLQSMGTEWGRALQPDLWLQYALKTAKTILEGGFLYDRAVGLVPTEGTVAPPGVLISDVRFHNELDMIKQSGGFLIRVRRDSTDGEAIEVGIAHHASEIGMDLLPDSKFNYVINNDGSLEDFISAVDVAGVVMTGSSQ